MFGLENIIYKLKQNSLFVVLLNSKAYFSMKNKFSTKSIAENPEQNFYPEDQMAQEEVKSYEIEMMDMTIENKQNKSMAISEEPSFLDFENRFVF